jgi:hypothetical protein
MSGKGRKKTKASASATGAATATISLDSLNPQMPLLGEPGTAPPGMYFELEHLLVVEATGEILFASTDWDTWLEQARIHKDERGLKYDSRHTGNVVPITRGF